MAPSSKSIHKEKKPRSSRKVKCEVTCHEPCHEPCVEEAVIVVPLSVPVPEPEEEEAVVVPESLEELCQPIVEDDSIMSAPVFDLSSSDEECPVSPCLSPKVKRVKKEVAPKALINEAGDYLNPKTNRYVKVGTAAFKKLVKGGLLVLAESI